MIQPIKQPDINPLFDLSKIAMTDFRVDNVSLVTPAGFGQEMIRGFKTEPQFSFLVYQDDKIVETILSITVVAEGDNSENPKAFFEIHFFFQVANLLELLETSVDSLLLDPALLNVCISTSYSMARGILATRLQGTIMRHYILPITDIASLMNS